MEACKISFLHRQVETITMKLLLSSGLTKAKYNDTQSNFHIFSYTSRSLYCHSKQYSFVIQFFSVYFYFFIEYAAFQFFLSSILHIISSMNQSFLVLVLTSLLCRIQADHLFHFSLSIFHFYNWLLLLVAACLKSRTHAGLLIVVVTVGSAMAK